MESEIKLGKYMHYKGIVHEVIGVAQHSENPKEKLVIYYHPDSDGTHKMYARPLTMFLEEVDVPEYNYKGPRFTYIGE